MNIVCFHNPDEENGFLSNWYISEFELDNIKFSSMEQYMMYQKAVCFNDDYIAGKILGTDDPREIKALGRKVSNFNSVFWNGVRQIVVYEGLMNKFSQNNNLRNKLLSTDCDVLAECSVSDTVWGIGISMHDSDRFDISKWKGQNLLGFALMMVRNHI